MSKESDTFEKRIHRIHELVDGTDARVTWNDRVPDPDNPKQSRQIDITIKRGDSPTPVECRTHNQPQDVKWIEELIGRRASLKAASGLRAVFALAKVESRRHGGRRHLPSVMLGI